MKQFFSFALCALFAGALMTTTSCGSPDDTAARGFVTRIIANFTKPNVDSVKVLYPGAEKCKAFRTKLLENSALKLKAGSDGEWTCSLGDSLRIIFVQDEETGAFTIKESFGFAHFGADRMAFARGTGWIDKKMNDLAIAERLTETTFVEWVGKGFIEQVKKNLKCVKTSTYGDERAGGKWICADGIIVTVSNYNDFAVSGDCYEILCVENTPGISADSVFQAGDDLPPHSNVPIRVDILNTVESHGHQELNFTDENILNLVFHNYKPNGSEYKRYKAAK